MVFAEGQNSEPDYLNGLRRLPDIAERAAIDLRVSPKRDVPFPLVSMAKDHVDDDETDEVWCVFDVEWPQNHPNLRAAVELARAHGVKLAISTPCFEIWLILHR